MGHVVLNTGACDGVIVSITDEAAEAVSFSFNPSGLPEVNMLKSLSAAFVAEAQRQKQLATGDACKDFAVAITNMQQASMWAVRGATRKGAS